ncbi:predicted protein [Thalassiosira pseudonana CCMP1335]|uniref:AAA+ ATPase domain-containing protein n=1 Tax=Thalassiosira pseudonana TaxID=35128 RepID=B8CEZ3_THAPS|nr:predicted protein [Thalassiosira pseudonana CCMP1335]EED87989.1 predicted protein [Thalassiosira pseudonana CCMP1335]
MSTEQSANRPQTTALVEPYQHLVESLRQILFFQSDGYSNQGSTSIPPIPRSFLFTGPPGVGKTYSVKRAISVANEWMFGKAMDTSSTHQDTIELVSIRGSELLASASSGGNFATAARELERQFRIAAKLCQRNNNIPDKEGKAKAVVVFLDECDALVSSSVIVASMLAMLLDMVEGNGDGWERLLVVAATNRVDAIPAFLRRPGRLEKEVIVNPPNAEERFALLENMLGTSLTSEGVSASGLRSVADTCVGYVAADLSALVRRAAILSMERRFHGDFESQSISLRPIMTTNDLFSAMNDVGASCLRDASLAAPPKTTWSDIAGDVGGAKQALRQAIEWPRTRKAAFTALGLSPPRGVLLHGPPGCAKTTLARAAAGAAGVAFLSLSPADVYSSSYVGEAESVVRRAFDLARSAAPCVLFFDEIDSIIGGEDESGGGKGHGMGRGTSAEARVLSTFLNEMDGVDGSVEDGVLVLGATNRPGTLDAALLRPGRFDRVIYVPPPDECGRRDILRMECTKWQRAILSCDSSRENDEASDDDTARQFFNIDTLASEDISGSMTGAELVGACRETAVGVMRTIMLSTPADESGKLSTTTKERLMQALKVGLITTLRNTRPLLSNANVLEEYTRFEEEHR